MKLLHVISSMDPSEGGVCYAVRITVASLAKKGIYNEVVCLDAPDAFWSQADPFLIHALGRGWGPWCYSSKLVSWLLDNLARFDTVVLHGLWLYNGFALRRALSLLKAHLRVKDLAGSTLPKHFIMPHGMLDPYFQKATSRKLKALRNWTYWNLIERATINEADGILFTSEAELQLARQSFPSYRPQREIVVGLGVEAPPTEVPAMQAAFLNQCPELQNRPYLLFLGRIHKKKGIEMLLQAYADNASTLASVSVAVLTGLKPFPAGGVLPVLVVAGPGLDTAYGRQIRRLAAALPATAVYFPGMLTGDAKWGAFYGCEAFVLPSHQENFGIAVAEALACGKPVLISNQVNIWREIAAGGGGTVEDDTLPGTQRLLQGWCRLTQDQKQAMSNCALATYRQYFAIEGAAQKMAAALQ